MTTDLKGLEGKLQRLSDSITGRALRRVLDQSGVEAKKIADREVQASIGDLSMSNWRRGNPIQIRTRYDHTGDTAITIRPASRATGPMTVLEQGRRAGVSKRGRPYGASRGKGTWSNAEQKMQTELPKPVERHVREALRKQFGG